MDGVELAALYTLQHRLPRNAEDAHGVIHGDESLGRFFDEAGSQLLGHADAPGRTWGKLLSGDDSVVEPAMDRGGHHAQTLGNLMHGQQLCVGCFGNGLVAGDAPVRAEAGDAIGGEGSPVAVRRPWRLRTPAMPNESTWSRSAAVNACGRFR